MRSWSVFGRGWGSYPSHRKMAPMDSIVGFVRPFSQLSTVQGSTPNSVASCLWVSPSPIRWHLTCSPRVLGRGSVLFGINPFSLTGKWATRPCRC